MDCVASVRMRRSYTPDETSIFASLFAEADSIVSQERGVTLLGDTVLCQRLVHSILTDLDKTAWPEPRGYLVAEA